MSGLWIIESCYLECVKSWHVGKRRIWALSYVSELSRLLIKDVRAGMESNWRDLGDRQRDKVNVRLSKARVMKED